MEHCENRDVGGVPGIVLHPAAEPAGHIVLYHGWGSTMESYQFLASLLAGWGYRVVVPELPWHGARGSLDYGDKATVQEYFWRVVLQGVQEAERIVQELTQSASSPIAMIGHSTGGFVTAGTFVKLPQVQAAVVINGSCAWVQFEQLYRAAIGMPPMGAAEIEELQRHDPLARIGRNPDQLKPLLLLHGKEDTIVPIESQRYFRDAVPSDRIRMIEYPRLNHHITLGMLQQIKEFLETATGRGARAT